LNERGYGEFLDDFYWSSTEIVDNSDYALDVDMTDGGPTYGYDKFDYTYVRAVSAF
jgi:hypothetical protein